MKIVLGILLGIFACFVIYGLCMAGLFGIAAWPTVPVG